MKYYTIRETALPHPQMGRDELIEGEFVSHQATTGSGGYETAEYTTTTEHEQPAGSGTVAHTTDGVEAPPAHLGNCDETPLGVHAGVVAPAVRYVITDGASWKGHYSPVDYFMGWYGHLGAEHHMRRNSIARASQHIPGKEAPEIRAHNMVKDLQSQGNAPSVGALGGSLDM
jgi:hypothetical protein